jgi:ubiquinone/menaquinone biosynthesis C-methylase UbiE
LDPTSIFSTKAEKYARYRWDYAPGAIRAVFDIAGLGSASRVADLGAGTGILTHHFAGKVAQVVAVEPNDEMRRQAELTLGGVANCQVSGARAEATGLADGAFDLVTVAQAIHWFQPEPARAEIQRILKPDGWLALLRNYGTNAAVEEATSRLLTPDYGVVFPADHERPERKPIEFYFGKAGYQKLLFPFANQVNWEIFFGAQLSASFMPDEGHPSYPSLDRGMREVFERFSVGGVLEVHGETELIIGKAG